MGELTEFDDLQFELQLELEGLSIEQLGEHGQKFRRRADRFGLNQQRRIDVALRVLLALKRTPGSDSFEAEGRFTAWCVGFGIPADECWDKIADMLQRRRSHDP